MTAFDSIAQLAFQQAITGLLVGTGIAAIAALLTRLAVKENSASRFAVLYSALLAVVGAFFWRAETHAVHSQATVVLSSRWATYFAIAWCAGSLVGLARILWGLRQLRQLRANLVPLDQEACLHQVFQSHAGHFRTARVYLSDRVRVPTAIGFFRPAVILPIWAVHELSADELRAAVSHELAHLSRWDDWTNLLQKFIRALLFFHPAVWWIDGRLAIERELSCDDAVLANSSSPRAYAECLVSLAEKSVIRRPIALAQAAVGKLRQTSLRVSRILSGKQQPSGKAWMPALAALGTLSMLSFVGAQHTPRLVSFDEKSTPSVVAKSRPSPPSQDVAFNRALVVPASVKLEPQSEPRVSHRKRGSPERLRGNTRVPVVPQVTIAKSSTPQPAHKTQVVNASAEQPSSSQPAAQFMYVVFQTREFDDEGGMRVTTTVWQVPIKNVVSTPDGVGPHST